MDDIQPTLDVHLHEFDKIKVEQAARIAFRDNLVYVTLVSYGAVMAFAAKDNHLALLILPWVSVVLGWGYLVNDEKVSAIGRYVRLSLSARIAALLGSAKADDIFGNYPFNSLGHFTSAQRQCTLLGISWPWRLNCGSRPPTSSFWP